MEQKPSTPKKLLQKVFQLIPVGFGTLYNILNFTKAILRSIKRRDFLYRKLKETTSDSIEYEHRKINVRTYNIILRRSIFNAKKNFYHSQF